MIAEPLMPDSLAPHGKQIASLGSRILTLLFLVRSSGNQIYKQELDLKETEISLVGALGRNGPMTHLQIVHMIGHGKSQVSRATRELVAAGIIERSHHRAPFQLTEAGMPIYQRMTGIAEERRTKLIAGLDDGDQQFLSEMISRLMSLGERWLADEKLLAGQAPVFDEPIISGAAGDIVSTDTLVPALIKMSVLMQRSSFLLWRRLAGISSFNWVVLSRVAEAGRLRMSRLVYLTSRDKSQVWRTVNRLTEDGLLLRLTEPGRREVELMATPEGIRLYDITAQLSERRDRVITSMLGKSQKERFQRLMNKMITNTQQMAGRETSA